MVAGAYRATPIRSLETETWVPPLDLYLNRRVADFKERLSQTGATAALQIARRRVARATLNRQDRRAGKIIPTDSRHGGGMDTTACAEWRADWLGKHIAEGALECDWRERWQQQLDKAMQERPSRDIEPADYPDFTEEALLKYRGLQKHESSLIV